MSEQGETATLCSNDGGVGIGAGHRCECVRPAGHANDSDRPHGCSCGALWADGYQFDDEERRPISREWTHEMDEEQRYVESVTNLLWPDETTEEAALALCEEAGEVARAVIKRNHAIKGSGDREPSDWSANLRRELAQVVVVAMKMAEREGFSLAQMIVDEREALDARFHAVWREKNRSGEDDRG